MNTPNELTPVTGTLETVVKKAGDKVPRPKQLRDSVNQALGTAKNAIADLSATTADTFKGAATSADAYVRENPWVAIGVTAGVAAAIGYLVGRLGPTSRR